MKSPFQHSRSSDIRRAPTRARLSLEQLEDRRVPANFTVMNLNDANDGSLRKAVEDANALAGADTILFRSDLTGTIKLAAEIPITDSVTITGPGAAVIAVSGDNQYRIFNIDNAAAVIDVSISGLTLTQGHAPAADGGAIFSDDEALVLSGVVISANSAGDRGGGIFIDNNGSLTLENSTLTGNSATFGGGIFFDDDAVAVIRNSTISGNGVTDGHGGGIFVDEDGALTIENSTLSGNVAAQGTGGGIRLEEDCTLIIRNSTISDNRADNNNAGGIYVDVLGVVTIENSTISGNQSFGTATIGGGILFEDTGGLIVRNSTISGNSAVDSGGGLYLPVVETIIENSTLSGNLAGNFGGAIRINTGPTTIRNSTIAFNIADSDNVDGGRGGGIYIADGGTATLQSTIVADNLLGTTGLEPDIHGTVLATNSLIENLTGTILAPGSAANITGVDPRLGPLANNGGATQTHALLAGSPAINAGLNLEMLAADQRGAGFLRVAGSGIDIGAFELQSVFPVTKQAVQGVIQLIQGLQRSGTRLAAAAFGDFNGDFSTDIAVALKLRNNRLLVVNFNGVDGSILGVFQPFPNRLGARARVQLMSMNFSGDDALEIALLVSNGGPGVPRIGIFSAAGTRLG